MEPNRAHDYPSGMPTTALALCLLAILLAPETAVSADPAAPLSRLAGKTAGGLQLWGDVALFHQWRIQRHTLTGHYRLLDGSDTRHAWGTLQTCQKALAEVRRRDVLPDMRGEAVLLLHGLGGTRRQMQPLRDFLAETGGYQVFAVGYPSTRDSIDQHAEQLALVMQSLEGIDRVHFVAHSLGNLVIRRWMTSNRSSDSGAAVDSRIGRVVMLGPPNHKPRLSAYLEPIDPNNAIAGLSGRALNRDWDKLEQQLATPSGDFGIIAGGKSDSAGWNPLIPGDDDFTVGVEETKLAGASDFRVVPVKHRSMPADRRVQQLALAFLRNGRFGKEDECQALNEASPKRDR